jgi:hypothetical protein
MFLLELFEHGHSFSMFKVYMTTISACHEEIDGATLGFHHLVVRLLKGVRPLRPVSKPIAPTWDLALDLEALCAAIFESLESVNLKILYYKPPCLWLWPLNVLGTSTR